MTLNSAQFGGDPFERVVWHGSPSGDLRGSHYGLHVGTKEAAEQALHARIGAPQSGAWDGSQTFGEGRPNAGWAKYSDGTDVPGGARPRLDAFVIDGPMTNGHYNAHDDFKANGYMAGQIKRGRAKSGYYYKNVSEDEGSISAVVPNGDHLRRPRGIARAATTMLGGQF